MKYVALFLFCSSNLLTNAQNLDGPVLIDDYYEIGEEGAAPVAELERYERLNKTLGADSVRLCDGFPCIGWVEDNYPDGTLKHKGYYDTGELVVYKNFHPNGAVERDFKQLDNVKSVLRTYHDNGNLRSEARFAYGVSFEFTDYYVDGTMRYEEVKHRKQPYYITMNLFAADGNPISKLQLVDKKNIEFVQQEFYPGGVLKCEGRARYDSTRMVTERIGTWNYFDTTGIVIREEDYAGGKLASVR